MTKARPPRIRPIFVLPPVIAVASILVLLAVNSRHSRRVAAERALAGESGLRSAFTQLRRDYGGNVPMRPGDGVPLIDGDETAEGVRALLRDARYGRARIASELLSEVPEDRRRCELHGTPLFPRLVPILYGLYEPSKDYQAKRTRFPRAATPCMGGCLGGAAEEAIVLSCESCETEKERLLSG